MTMRIEDYALIGDLETAALVGRDGSVDWLCLPRFDSASVFSRLVGDERHGHWRLAPAAGGMAPTRRYLPGTLVLETTFESGDGAVRVIDFMPRRATGAGAQLMRVVEGVRGTVPMRMELVLRPDYGAVTPWIEPAPDGVVAVAGPDAFRLSTPLRPRVEDGAVTADFTLAEGARERLTLSWWPSFAAAPPVEDADSALARTRAFWEEWSGRCAYDGEHRDAVVISLVALKAMTSETTGGIIAAPTTSLPEELGGIRNWDYRYCWLRDSVLALEALLASGYLDEALGFRDFMLRVATGHPASAQIMYAVDGQRRLPEIELDLPGYEGSRPVRVGNAAAEQFQLDVYGEVLGVAAIGAERLGRVDVRRWPRWRAVVEHVERVWREPDDGIWEARGPRRHYTYSKVMAWVVFDRAVQLAERFGLDAPLERWRRVRDEVHAEVCEHGFDAERGTFTQHYGSRELDASVLNIPLVGFLPATDERVTGTIDAVARELGRDGFVARYSTAETDDGLPGSEGQFLACSFWLVSALALNGRAEQARRLFERLLELRNDVGLLAEEWDVERQRQVGNFPQAFSHLALVNAAHALADGARADAAPRFARAPSAA
jgi:GH15 family glucan-1,4-alpha-glucosidase